MGRAKGLRARTRDSFSRAFRKKGVIPLSTYLRTFKVGQYVDIKVNSAVHKGMPFKVYHGRTGVVWNVTKRAVGVEVNKEVTVLLLAASPFLCRLSLSLSTLSMPGCCRLHSWERQGTQIWGSSSIFLSHCLLGQWPDHEEAHPCAHRARRTLPLSRGVPQPREEQR